MRYAWIGYLVDIEGFHEQFTLWDHWSRDKLKDVLAPWSCYGIMACMILPHAPLVMAIDEI